MYNVRVWEVIIIIGVLLKTLFYCRPSFIEDPNGRLVGDTQILGGDHHIFIGSQIVIPYFHWRPQIFIGDPHIFIGDPHIIIGDPQIFVGYPKILIDDPIFSL